VEEDSNIMQKTVSNYDKYPVIEIEGNAEDYAKGWVNIGKMLNKKISEIPGTKKIIVFECYAGILNEEVIPELRNEIKGDFFFSESCMLDEEDIHKLVYPDVTDDEIFGYITRLRMHQFFDGRKILELQEKISSIKNGVVCLYGTGASLIYSDADLLVYLDMPRWEGQLRFRRNEISNLGVCNKTEKASLQYKQAFFVDWRVCDRLKKQLLPRIDYVIDTTQKGDPKIISGALFHKALDQAVKQPFRLVPFFDPGPWGGQWMKKVFDLDKDVLNFAWCFDCVPEENSLLFKFGDIIFETPSINLVFTQSKKLLGDAVQARFGDEFPIRFDFLDTMEGGNLSLQVHPTTEYIQENFGMHYTQDESYYMLDAGEDACVYLGLKETIHPDAMISELKKAQNEAAFFDAEKHVEKWPVKKHDHVLIPAGTVHCSGANSMVLEISATPYIFTFKLWDWGRLGLDGLPRPINIEHGKKVIDWSRKPDFTKRELVNVIETVANGEGWKEERTGLHEREFIETRRHWFTKPVTHYTNGSVNVLNLVEGREAIIESPDGSFEPFVVHYAETFVIPENVKTYTIKPYGESEGKQCVTIKAYVRTKP
jgi:mannose-6-phosphate isomerase class I